MLRYYDEKYRLDYAYKELIEREGRKEGRKEGIQKKGKKGREGGKNGRKERKANWSWIDILYFF